MVMKRMPLKSTIFRLILAFFAYIFLQPIGSTRAGLLPVINSQPVNQTALPGETATFTVTASNGAPLTYQWYFNNTNAITGATNAAFTITNVEGWQIGFYSVQVS